MGGGFCGEGREACERRRALGREQKNRRRGVSQCAHRGVRQARHRAAVGEKSEERRAKSNCRGRDSTVGAGVLIGLSRCASYRGSPALTGTWLRRVPLRP